jgi:hypothetical protein
MSNNHNDLHKTVICLFDVDGTITDPRQVSYFFFFLFIYKFCLDFNLMNKTNFNLENSTKYGRVFREIKIKSDCRFSWWI